MQRWRRKKDRAGIGKTSGAIFRTLVVSLSLEFHSLFLIVLYDSRFGELIELRILKCNTSIFNGFILLSRQKYQHFPPIELKSWNISSIKHSNDFEESRILIFCNPSRTFYSCASRPGKINRGPTAKTGRASISRHALPRPWRKCCDVVSSSDLFFEFTTLNGIFSRLSGWALSWSHLVIYLFMLTRTKAKSRRTVAKSPQETKKC